MSDMIHTQVVLHKLFFNFTETEESDESDIIPEVQTKRISWPTAKRAASDRSCDNDLPKKQRRVKPSISGELNW